VVDMGNDGKITDFRKLGHIRYLVYLLFK